MISPVMRMNPVIMRLNHLWSSHSSAQLPCSNFKFHTKMWITLLGTLHTLHAVSSGQEQFRICFSQIQGQSVLSWTWKLMHRSQAPVRPCHCSEHISYSNTQHMSSFRANNTAAWLCLFLCNKRYPWC